ncbi:hypothetical protein AAMO2058_000616800 [Amorphochlora amoebiformis]
MHYHSRRSHTGIENHREGTRAFVVSALRGTILETRRWICLINAYKTPIPPIQRWEALQGFQVIVVKRHLSRSLGVTACN